MPAPKLSAIVSFPLELLPATAANTALNAISNVADILARSNHNLRNDLLDQLQCSKARAVMDRHARNCSCRVASLYITPVRGRWAAAEPKAQETELCERCRQVIHLTDQEFEGNHVCTPSFHLIISLAL